MILEEEPDICSRSITRTSLQAVLFQSVVEISRKVLAGWLLAVFQLAHIPAGLLQVTGFVVCMLPISNELIMLYLK